MLQMKRLDAQSAIIQFRFVDVGTMKTIVLPLFVMCPQVCSQIEFFFMDCRSSDAPQSTKIRERKLNLIGNSFWLKPFVHSLVVLLTLSLFFSYRAGIVHHSTHAAKRRHPYQSPSSCTKSHIGKL